MIKCISIQNYKALRDVKIELTPIHLLIGPNDSGKTSVLEAVAALCRSVDHELVQAFTGLWDGQRLVWQGMPDSKVSISAAVEHGHEQFQYVLSVRFGPAGRVATCDDEQFVSRASPEPMNISERGQRFSRVWHVTTHASADGELAKVARSIRDSLGGVQFYQWVPRMLALPVAPDSKRRFRMESSGFGLALFLDDILGFDRDRFGAMEVRFRQIFPHVKSIKLLPEPAFRGPCDDPEQIPRVDRADGKGLYFEFTNSTQLVSASQLSDGMLLVLAYLAVLFSPQPPRVVLVEEPENGIHPNRLQDVMKILRELVHEQTHSQVILTTHSPYVVDLFPPNEVTLCRRQEDGSVAVCRLSESKAVRKQIDVFTLGEIWTAEGDEALAKAASDAGATP